MNTIVSFWGIQAFRPIFRGYCFSFQGVYLPIKHDDVCRTWWGKPTDPRTEIRGWQTVEMAITFHFADFEDPAEKSCIHGH